MSASYMKVLCASGFIWSVVAACGDDAQVSQPIGGQASTTSGVGAGATGGTLQADGAGTASGGVMAMAPAGSGTGPVTSTGDAAAPAGQDAAAVPVQMDASTADAGDASTQPVGEPPAPVAEPYAWGFGLGVTDLTAAVDFYTEVMSMTVEREVTRSDRTEVVLYASEVERGARLILMKFDDGRETRNITAKLVWQSSDASGVNRAASDYPDYVSRLSFGIVQFDGPDTYIQEVGGIFDSGGGQADTPYLVALGFSTSDLAASRTFYTDGLGMEETPVGSFTVTDATGRGSITEYSVKYPTGAGLVLQGWSPARESRDRPVKVVLFVPDAQAAADRVVAAGGSIVEPAMRTDVYDQRLLIVAKDLDGYLLELVQ